MVYNQKGDVLPLNALTYMLFSSIIL